MLLIVVAAVVLLGGGAGGTWFYLQKKHAAAAADEEPAPKAAEAEKPIYLPLENMVVNLADPGGERFAQIGVTLDLTDEKAADQIKNLLPAVRSSVLMLVSQRSSDELLKRDGKEKLAADITAEVSRTLGFEDEAPPPRKKAKAADSDDDEDAPVKPKKKRKAPVGPVKGVLFSSFIVQ